MVVSTALQQPPTVTSVLNMLYGVVEQEVVSAAEAMPEDKYSFAPTNGEFKGVRTFAEQVKHIGFANHLYFGPLMGETIDANSIEENANGPAALKTKAEIVQYLRFLRARPSGHFRDHLRKRGHAAAQARIPIPLNASRNRHYRRLPSEGSLRSDGRVPADEWYRPARKPPAATTTTVLATQTSKMKAGSQQLPTW